MTKYEEAVASAMSAYISAQAAAAAAAATAAAAAAAAAAIQPGDAVAWVCGHTNSFYNGAWEIKFNLAEEKTEYFRKLGQRWMNWTLDWKAKDIRITNDAGYDIIMPNVIDEFNRRKNTIIATWEQ